MFQKIYKKLPFFSKRLIPSWTVYKHYHDFANLWPFLAFFCHFSHFTHNLCEALVDTKDYTRYILWLFCIYILFFYEFASENWLILEGIVFIILVWWLRSPNGGGHFYMQGELVHQSWSNNTIYSSIYQSKAFELANLNIP